MDKRDTIIEYFNSFSIYELIWDQENGYKGVFNKEIISYSKVAILNNLFLLEKEVLIGKLDNGKYISNVIDEKIEEIVSSVAKKEGNNYRIGDCILDDKNVVAHIRNKLAHGDYYIKATENIIILNNPYIELDIDKLCLCIILAMQNILINTKVKEKQRNLVISNVVKIYKDKKITTEKELINSLKFYKIHNFSLKSINNENLSEKALNIFQIYIGAFNNQLNMDPYKYERIQKAMDDLCKKENLVLYHSKSGIKKPDTVQRIINRYKNAIIFYQISIKDQSNFISHDLLNFECDDYENISYMYANQIHLSTLDYMAKNKYSANKFFYNLDQMQANMINANFPQLAISSTIARFNILYIYPLEDIYTKSKYSLNREYELDFSLLDLSNFNPDILSIETPILDELNNVINSQKKELTNLSNIKNEMYNNYNIVIKNKNFKASNSLQSKIQSIKSSYNELLIKYNQNVNMKALIRDDYNKNELYFRNRAIITGIRNAISHGNIEIDIYNSIIPNDNIITFTDKIKVNNQEKIVFKLIITLEQFKQIFDKNNLNTLCNFLYPDRLIKVIDNNYI